MGAEHLWITFRYQCGEQVWIAGRQESYRVIGQQYETRVLFPPLTTYTLVDETTGAVLKDMAEADLSPAPTRNRLQYYRPAAQEERGTR